MTNFSILTLVAAAACLGSTALAQGGPIESCTLTIFNAQLGGCTTHAATATDTLYTDCSGCVLSTEYVRGPQCASLTTALDTTTKSVVACSPSQTCTKTVPQSFGALSSATCTDYAETVTQTVSADCGGYAGCGVVTAAGGPGPAVECGTRVTSPTATAYSTTCTA